MDYICSRFHVYKRKALLLDLPLYMSFDFEAVKNSKIGLLEVKQLRDWIYNLKKRKDDIVAILYPCTAVNAGKFHYRCRRYSKWKTCVSSSRYWEYINWFCHIRAGATQASLSSVPRHLCNDVLMQYFPPCNLLHTN